MTSIPLVVSLLSLTTATLAQQQQQPIYQGFNSGNTFPDRTPKTEDDFLKEFTTFPKLKNSPGAFNSVRLYTSIQANTPDQPLSAFPAAIKTNTSILLGIWCSGTTNITSELRALTTAVRTYGADLADAVIAISVGSEDLYRASESGARNDAGVGADPATIARFINQTRAAIRGTPLAGKPVGHVDTWSAWTNGSNREVVDAVDWLGVDIYPFFESDKGNSIERAETIFEDLFNRTLNASDGKPVWVTETGWPYDGPSWGQARADVADMERYWQAVGCGELFGRVSTWWYTFRDANPDAKEKFAVADDGLSTTPRFNLSCPPGSGAPATINMSGGSILAVWASVVKAMVLAGLLGFLLAYW